MTPISLNTNIADATYTSTTAQKPADSVPASGDTSDSVQLSPAAREASLTGRIAMNQDAGNISGSQAQPLYSQVSFIQSQITTDEQNDGGTLSPSDAQNIAHLQSYVGDSLCSDAHNGAPPPANPVVNPAEVRTSVEAGRIVLNEKAGNLSSTQAQQLGSQLATIHQQITSDMQADGGTLSPTDAQAINQMQNQFSQQIYTDAHPS